MNQVRFNHLLGLEGLSQEVITEILDSAEAFLEVLERPIPSVPSLPINNFTDEYYRILGYSSI